MSRNISSRGRGLRKANTDASSETTPNPPEPSAAPPPSQAPLSRTQGLSSGGAVGRGRGLFRAAASCSNPSGLLEPVPSKSSELPPASGSATGLQATEKDREQSQGVQGRRRGRGLAGKSIAPVAPTHPAPDSSQSGPTSSGDSAVCSKEKKDAFNLQEPTTVFAHLPKVGQNSFRDYRKRGTQGKPIKLMSNCYGLEFPDANWYKYDVQIHRGNEQQAVELEHLDTIKLKDRIASRGLCRDIMLHVFNKHGSTLGHDLPAYDGRKILILNRKPFDGERYFTVNVPTPRGRTVEYTVKLMHVLDIDVSSVDLFYKGKTNTLDPEVLQAVNIVVDTSFSNKKWVAVNRLYYEPGKVGRPLGGGKELREGIYTATMYADWKPLLVVDKARTVFAAALPLIDYAADVLGTSREALTMSGLNAGQVETLKKEVKSLMVKLEHTTYGRTVKISGITRTPVNRTMFMDEQKQEKSVAAYFAQTYPKTPLRYPNLQCIEVKRANLTKTDYFPIEVCIVKRDQPSWKKLNPDQTAKMIRVSQEKPHERFQFLRNNIGTIASANELKKFGLRLSDTPIMTDGRTLESPGIRVGNRSIEVRAGSWQLPEFHIAAEVPQWVVVDCADLPRNYIDKLASMLKQQGEKMKMRISYPTNILARPNWRMPATTKQMMEEIRGCHRDPSKPLLAVIVLSRNTSYSEIKSLTETNENFKLIVTQCIKSDNVRNEKKLNFSFVDNLFKKINAKLNGVNSIVQRVPKVFQEEYIVLGADVTHPSPGDMNPSIAAVVGSINNDSSKYCTEISVQCSESSNRIEYIINLREIVLKLLKAYVKRNDDRKPKYIYYLRDGVSDGQFQEVRYREVLAIRQACYDLQVHYQPSITVLVAQKRHHVRFTVVDSRTGTRSGNIPPGTYIDRDVVHAKNHDFYMYTHEGLIGTSRPTHYQLIHADKPISTDEITEMIYYLTHNYARASRSVSIPAPIYYAHLAAFRAKEHLKADPTLCGSSSVSSGSDDIRIDLRKYQQACDVNDATKDKLYYA
ncbi:protein argonaute-2-like [Varroa destructor]|uniref:Uncharacterized protein n=1 Tax=Varroa destructor TaxID=109461 RepID=A0A7M7J408_VARDE|nr:protein argonaute-2-like [Varroa destructor]